MTVATTEGIKTVLHPVSDLAKATPVYTALLGIPPQHEAPVLRRLRRLGASTSAWCRAVERRA